MTWPEIVALLKSNPPGTIARTNGSPWHPTPIIDLIGIKDRKYLDYNATHRLRGRRTWPAMPFWSLAAMRSTSVRITSYGETANSSVPLIGRACVRAGQVHLLAPAAEESEPKRRRAPSAGKKIFDREGCGGCHAGPSYGNNEANAGKGCKPPQDHPYRADMLLMSVGTEPCRGTETRKRNGAVKDAVLDGPVVPEPTHARCIGCQPRGVVRSGPASRRLRSQGVQRLSGRAPCRAGPRIRPAPPAQEKAALISFLRTL